MRPQPRWRGRLPKVPNWLEDAVSTGVPDSSASTCGGSSPELGASPWSPSPEPPEAPRAPLSADYFYRFVRLREEVRVRREVLRAPPEEWYASDPEFRWMRTTRLTNVKRRDDRMTRVVRRLSEEAASRWLEPETDRTLLARLLVFNHALWRAFGTESFAKEVGFLWHVRRWDDAEIAPVVDAAVNNWSRGRQNFSDAYRPPRHLRAIEGRTIRTADVEGAKRLYGTVCKKLQPLWEACGEIAQVALRRRSWELATLRLMKVHGFGGTGFMAKELIQDLMHTPLFEKWDADSNTRSNICVDRDTWCIIGPGARRGLNRLHGRRVDTGAYSGGRGWHSFFLKELLALFAQREGRWSGEMLGHPVGELELHDVQFQLCELDKHERAKYGEGRVRSYNPPGRTWVRIAPIVQPGSVPRRRRRNRPIPRMQLMSAQRVRCAAVRSAGCGLPQSPPERVMCAQHGGRAADRPHVQDLSLSPLKEVTCAQHGFRCPPSSADVERKRHRGFHQLPATREETPKRLRGSPELPKVASEVRQLPDDSLAQHIIQQGIRAPRDPLCMLLLASVHAPHFTSEFEQHTQQSNARFQQPQLQLQAQKLQPPETPLTPPRPCAQAQGLVPAGRNPGNTARALVGTEGASSRPSRCQPRPERYRGFYPRTASTKAAVCDSENKASGPRVVK